jgi:hypothetical protein
MATLADSKRHVFQLTTEGSMPFKAENPKLDTKKEAESSASHSAQHHQRISKEVGN